MVINSLKYAFIGKNTGSIQISFRRVGENSYFLEFKDNGIGFPADFNFDNLPSLDFKLVSSLTEQFKGSLNFRTDNGAVVEMVFNNP